MTLNEKNTARKSGSAFEIELMAKATALECTARTLAKAMIALGAWEELVCDAGLHLDDLRMRVAELQNTYTRGVREYVALRALEDEERAA